MGQQIFEIGDLVEQLVILVLKLLTFERRQPAQLHIENRLRLDLGKLKVFHQIVARRLHILAAANRVDHLVENIERAQQPFDNVGTVTGAL